MSEVWTTWTGKYPLDLTMCRIMSQAYSVQATEKFFSLLLNITCLHLLLGVPINSPTLEKAATGALLEILQLKSCELLECLIYSQKKKWCFWILFLTSFRWVFSNASLSRLAPMKIHDILMFLCSDWWCRGYNIESRGVEILLAIAEATKLTS